MTFDLSTFFAPTVIATIISTGLAFITAHRKQTLDYTTAEHSGWRKRIKKGMEDLIVGFGNANATKLALHRIKVELNPYGQTIMNATVKTRKHWWSKKIDVDNEEYYLKDGHIWVAIGNYEQSPSEDTLQLLLKRLEYKLKYDWDRNKVEIAGKTKWILPALFLPLIGIACLAIPNLETINLADSTLFSGYVCIGVLIYGICFLPFPFFVKLVNKKSAIFSVLVYYLFLFVLLFIYLLYSNYLYLISFLIFAVESILVLSAAEHIGNHAPRYIRYCKALTAPPPSPPPSLLAKLAKFFQTLFQRS